MKVIRILIADDHNLVRDGIRALLESFEDIEVICEASNGIEAMDLAKLHHPDVVLMDIGMSRLNGLDAASAIVRDVPPTRVLMLSMHENEEYVIRALRAGASGYLLKDVRKPELADAIRSVAAGKTYLSSQVSRHVIDDYVQSVDGEKSPLEVLTPRQRETLKLIAQGHSTKEIAAMLNLSVKTVDTHRTQLMDRLDIHDVTGLVRFAIKAGLVNLSDS